MICSHDHLVLWSDTRHRLKENAANAKSAARDTIRWIRHPPHSTFIVPFAIAKNQSSSVKDDTVRSVAHFLRCHFKICAADPSADGR
jgi:hypothetical protein